MVQPSKNARPPLRHDEKENQDATIHTKSKVQDQVNPGREIEGRTKSVKINPSYPPQVIFPTITYNHRIQQT
jgi:hypothetical protein